VRVVRTRDGGLLTKCFSVINLAYPVRLGGDYIELLGLTSQIMAYGPERGLGTVSDSQFVENMVYMIIHRAGSDAQRLPDLLVG
jgi:hypothetical protein